MADTVPFADDPARSVALLREALLARGPPEESARPWRSALEDAVARGTAHGFLFREDGSSVGLAVWDPTSPIGATVEVAYLAEGARGPGGYRALFRAIGESSGGIAFAPGGLAGLSDADEQQLMRGLGFGRFARSEMRLPSEVEVPPPSADPDRPFRTFRPTDEASIVSLHRRAYDGQFDQYLFLADRDPDRDAESAVRELLAGRWGEFLPWASPIADGDDGPSGAVLVVRAPYGPSSPTSSSTRRSRVAGSVAGCWSSRSVPCGPDASRSSCSTSPRGTDAPSDSTRRSGSSGRSDRPTVGTRARGSPSARGSTRTERPVRPRPGAARPLRVAGSRVGAGHRTSTP